MKEVSFLRPRQFPLTLTGAHSKGLESGCWFRFLLPLFDYTRPLMVEGIEMEL